MTANSSKKRSDENRKRIIETAFVLFYHKGFNQTSFSDIAEAADFPRGNFYYYFKSKDDLLKEVVQYLVERARQAFVAWNTVSPDPAARLMMIVDRMEAWRDEVVQYGCPVGTLTAELGKTQSELQIEAAHVFDMAISWMAEQFDELGFGDDSKRLAMRIMARMQGVASMAFAYHDAAFMDYEIADIRAELNALVNRAQESPGR